MAEELRQDTETVELSEEEKSSIRDVLDARGATRPCELCGVNKWEIGDYLISPSFVKRTGTAVGLNFGLLQTSVSLVCLNCGNGKMLAVGVLGTPEVSSVAGE